MEDKWDNAERHSIDWGILEHKLIKVWSEEVYDEICNWGVQRDLDLLERWWNLPTKEER